MKQFIRAAILSVLVACLAGCTPHKMYRSNVTDICNFAKQETQCAKNALQVYRTDADRDSEYFLGFVEFDDQGQLWSRSQMHAVLQGIDDVIARGIGEVAKSGKLTPRAPDTSGKRDPIMVVFVHGWKHGATPGDKNIVHFRGMLKEISARESRNARELGIQDGPRPVVGVYLAWRGLSIDVPYIVNLTFWERKNHAQKVGRGGVTEVLERLELIKLNRDKVHATAVQRKRIEACFREARSDKAQVGCVENAFNEKMRKSYTRLIVIGHSFGGAVVYSSVSQVLKDRHLPVGSGVQGAASGKKNDELPIEGFGDLVVLLNPAFEANLYTSLESMAREKKPYAADQRPVLAILTSEADEATGTMFPLGRWFSTIFETDRIMKFADVVNPGRELEIDQTQSNRQTVGHFEPYTTHTLRPGPKPAGAAATSGKPKTYQEIYRQLRCTYTKWKIGKGGSKLIFPTKSSSEDVVLHSLRKSVARNPYLVVRVDKDLIPDHNQIYDPRVTDFILGMLYLVNYQPRTQVPAAASLSADANAPC